MQRLRLREYHELGGALFRPEGGWEVPASYGLVASEVRAVRSYAGMTDLSDRVKVHVRGADRTSFLDGVVTSDMKTLGALESAYALVLTDKSRVVGDVRVYAFEDRFVLDLEASQATSVLAYMQKFLVSDDVAFEDVGPCGHIEVHGPASARVLTQVLGADVRGLVRDRAIRTSVDRREVVACRVDSLRERGFAVWSPGSSLEAVWSGLSRLGVSPVGREAIDVVRIEAGVPRVGSEMGEETLALEVAPEGAISFTKGCYVGQEIVARGTYQGHIRRKLAGLLVDGDVPPAHGDRVRMGEKDVGAVTSGCWSPSIDRVVALALLRADDIAGATELFIDRGGWDLRAQPNLLPFVRERV